MKTVTLTYKISVTNLEFTLGLTEDAEKGVYIPRTLRVNDRSVERSAGGEIVDFIFEKDASEKTYRKRLVSDSEKTIPECIRHMIEI